MIPTHFQGENGLVTSTLVTNKGEPVRALPVLREADQHGAPVFTSMWRPSKEELQLLNFGGAVVLTCVGGQPVCSVDVAPAEMIVETV